MADPDMTLASLLGLLDVVGLIGVFRSGVNAICLKMRMGNNYALGDMPHKSNAIRCFIDFADIARRVK